MPSLVEIVSEAIKAQTIKNEQLQSFAYTADRYSGQNIEYPYVIKDFLANPVFVASFKTSEERDTQFYRLLDERIAQAAIDALAEYYKSYELHPKPRSKQELDKNQNCPDCERQPQ